MIKSTIADTSQLLAVSPLAFRAILRTECGDPAKWLDPKGRPWLRVEAELVTDRWAVLPSFGGDGATLRVLGPKQWQGHQIRYDGAWMPYHPGDHGYTGIVDEWDALDAAQNMIGPAAYECASWGPGQVMGHHWRDLGYPSVFDLVADASKSPLEPIRRYLQWDRKALAALRAHDWHAFAAAYNGPANADEYGPRIDAAYRAIARSIGWPHTP